MEARGNRDCLAADDGAPSLVALSLTLLNARNRSLVI